MLREEMPEAKDTGSACGGSWRRSLGCQPQKEASTIEEHDRKIVKYHSNIVIAIQGTYTHKSDFFKIMSFV